MPPDFFWILAGFGILILCGAAALAILQRAETERAIAEYRINKGDLTNPPEKKP